MLKKKSKPINKYSLIDTITKTFYTGDLSYVPTEIIYYEDRIEFLIDRCTNEGAEELKGTAKITGQRLLPIDCKVASLYWDIKDFAFRMRPLPKGNPKALIPQILFYPNETISMERKFAEKYLSEAALSYAQLIDDKYIWFYPDGSIAPVVFEIPKLFADFCNDDRSTLCSRVTTVINNLSTYTPSYFEETGLNIDNMIGKFNENLKRG